MFLAQLAASMLVWAATVVALVRRRDALIAAARALSRPRRAAAAAGRLVLSVVVLGLGMFALAHGGLAPGGLTAWGWPLITVVGSAFVALQTTGLVPLVLNAATPVTREGDGSSDRLDRP